MQHASQPFIRICSAGYTHVWTYIVAARSHCAAAGTCAQGVFLLRACLQCKAHKHRHTKYNFAIFHLITKLLLKSGFSYILNVFKVLRGDPGECEKDVKSPMNPISDLPELFVYCKYQCPCHLIFN